MKTLTQFLFASAIFSALSLASQANAQYKPTGADGITASPRVRQQLDERVAATRAAASVPVAAIGHRTSRLDSIAASPKVRQMLAERKVVASATSTFELVTAGYRATGPDGITASPRLRQELDERADAGVVSRLPGLPRAFTKN